MTQLLSKRTELCFSR